MRHVRVERTDSGFFIDPREYLARLDSIADLLPDGARAFATDPAHYDLHSARTVKNLEPTEVVATSEGRDLLLRLRHSCWHHEEDLTIAYRNVAGISYDPASAGNDVTGLGAVLLDEILPSDPGCSHEIVCVGGTVTVAAQDLTATWARADCPERHSEP